MSENVVWKDVVGYEGWYQVSDRGNVSSVERIGLDGRKIGGRILKPSDRGNGYLKVDLHNNGKRKTKHIRFSIF